MTRRAETGHRALMALVVHDPVLRAQATEALRRHLQAHDGNATRAAKALGLSASPALLPLVDVLGLREWLEEKWPARRTKKDRIEP